MPPLVSLNGCLHHSPQPIVYSLQFRSFVQPDTSLIPSCIAADLTKATQKESNLRKLAKVLRDPYSPHMIISNYLLIPAKYRD